MFQEAEPNKIDVENEENTPKPLNEFFSAGSKNIVDEVVNGLATLDEPESQENDENAPKLNKFFNSESKNVINEVETIENCQKAPTQEQIDNYKPSGALKELDPIMATND